MSARVSVVTPVYNGQRYLGECIESVLHQTHTDWEYLILDNVSSDETAAIAEKYAAQDARIRVLRPDSFVDIYTNHNRALAATDPRSVYCKVLQADDTMDPACLEKMVGVAELNPSVGLVSAFRSVGGDVERRVPVAPTQTVRRGPEVVRQEMLGLGWATGSPSTSLLRADLVRGRADFYDTTFWHADTDAAYRVLMCSDFGFVHEVLTFTRLHAEAQSSFTMRVNSLLSGDGRLLLRYGRGALSPTEYRRRRRNFLGRYGLFLAAARLKRANDREFMEFHARELGYTIGEAGQDPLMRSVLRAYRRALVKAAQPQLNRR